MSAVLASAHCSIYTIVLTCHWQILPANVSVTTGYGKWPLKWCVCVAVTLQAYLVLSGFYRSYGGLAILLCPLRTWAILLAVYLRRRSLSAGSQLHEAHVRDTTASQRDGTNLDEPMPGTRQPADSVQILRDLLARR